MRFLKYIVISTVFILLTYNISFAQSSEITKHALIFAIGDYPTDSTGWPKINAANDAVLMKDALDFQGFEDITVIQDTAATKKGIITNIKKFTEGLLEGDFAVIHFSCHGQLLEDDNGNKVNGYDEAIVPIDAPSGKGKFAPLGYKGEKHLRDDELDTLLFAIRKKLGSKGELLLILDAGHSGVQYNGSAKCRGNMPAYKYSGKLISSAVGDDGVFLFKDQVGENLSSYVVICASRPNENNAEIQEFACGSLSFAIAKALRECYPNIIYRRLIDNILAIMSSRVPNQIPTIEGSIDRKVFNGEIIARQQYLTIYDVIDDKTIIINSGNTGGIADSSMVAVYPNATYDIKGKKPILTGMIVSSDNTTSNVLLNSKLLINNKATKWIYITSRSFNDMKLNISTEDMKNPSLNNFIYNDLHANNMVNVVNDTNADLVIARPKIKGQLNPDIFNSKNGSIFKTNVKKELIDNYIETYIQGKFIKELKFDNPDYRVEVEIIPVKKGSFEPLDIKNYLVKGIIEFDTTVQFIFRVKNTGKLSCYYNIAEIKPDGKINAVLPSNDPQFSKFGADNFFIEPGRTKDIEVRLSGHQPYGVSIYKVFASSKMIDIRSIINNYGKEKRDGETIFEKVFRESFINNENFNLRGSKLKTIPADIGISTSNYPVVFKKK